MRLAALSTLAVAATTSLLAACASAGPTPTVTYVCEDRTELAVQFNPDMARVTLPGGGKVSLPQQIAGSGIWYSTPQYELRGKGDDATWTVGRRAPVNCKVRR